MAKIQIKSEKLTSFGGIFPIMEKFDRMLSRTIDSTLGLRCKVRVLHISVAASCSYHERASVSSTWSVML